MTKLIAAALTALLIAGVTPAAAATDCDGGYKSFLGKMVRMVDTVPTATIADAVRKSLSVYDACQAGDSLSTHGTWDQIAADLESKMKK